jgi:hypothetical protein
MIIVADASVLVAELARTRGTELVRNPRLRVVVTEQQWSETRHEIDRRLRLRVRQGRMTADQARQVEQDLRGFITDIVIEVIASDAFEQLEVVARRRIPRDPNDWPTVALAIALGADILTNDHDFLGCGCATWTFETLRDELAHSDALH